MSMIDVIIPTYNRVQSLGKVIDSYFFQKELGVCIIVDDWSTDRTAEWVQELSKKNPGKILYVKPEKKLTMPELRNIGISLSRNDYIFMGEDDVLLPERHFAILLEKLSRYSADIIAGRRIDLHEGETFEQAIINANKDRNSIFVRIPFEAYFDRYLDTAREVLHLHSNALMKRSIFEKVAYDPQFGTNGFVFREETDFFMRAHAAGYKIWIIPDTLSFHLKKMIVNKTGGSRRPRLIFEYLVWRNTWRFMIKNREIFKQELHVENIRLFALICLIARYFYALLRRIKKHYA